jgi:hypothetical protein
MKIRMLILAFSAALCLTACSPDAAVKTISYYSDNVGERIDKVLSCTDGAEDPNSLGCRNARASRELDKMTIQHNAAEVALEKWGSEGAIAKDPVKRGYQVLQLSVRSIRSAACVLLDSNKAAKLPQTPYREKIYKAALDEKLIESIPGKPDAYTVTKRGVEFLSSQADNAAKGFFCPINVTFGPDPRVLETQDLSAQYKGLKFGAQTISKLHVYTVAFDLNNTGASVWFVRKVSPMVLPIAGKVITKTIVVEYEGIKGEYSNGGVYEMDGKLLGDTSIEKLLERYTKAT